MNLDRFYIQLEQIGGIERCGQSGFCMLAALWKKAGELQSTTFSMSNIELAFKAGFSTQKRFYEVRKDLQEKGFFTFENIMGKKSLTGYHLNKEIFGLATGWEIDRQHQAYSSESYEGYKEQIPIKIDMNMQDRMDSGIDNGMDNGMDSRIDSGIDNGMDNGMDSRIDSGIDNGMDSRIDNGIDSRIDNGIDSRIDNGIDSRIDNKKPQDTAPKPSDLSQFIQSLSTR